MNKKGLVVFVLLLAVAISSVFAASFKAGTYSAVGFDCQIRFYGGNGVIISIDGDTWNSAGTYRADGSRVIVVFNRTSERTFRDFSGKTTVFRISDGGSLYEEGTSLEWVFIKGN